MLQAKSPAKINLFLEITSRRPDNFHNLCSVFQTTSLSDELTLQQADRIELEYLDLQSASIPTADNLIIKAVRLLQQRYNIKTGGKFTLRKNIPSCAGLGGGSSNAATALLMTNRLWDLNCSRKELAEIGCQIGSDVPFFIHAGYDQAQQTQNDTAQTENSSRCKGERHDSNRLFHRAPSYTALCRGRGEVITPLAEAATIPVRIISPEWGIPTPKAFSLLTPQRFNQYSTDDFIHELNKPAPDLEKLHELSFNHFEEAIFTYEPRQQELHNILIENNLLPRMSGSGSAVFLFGTPTTTELEKILPTGCKVVL